MITGEIIINGLYGWCMYSITIFACLGLGFAWGYLKRIREKTED